MKRIFVLAVFTALFVAALYFVYAAFARVPSVGSATPFEVTDGMSSVSIAGLLQEKGIIPSQWEYRLYSWLSATARHPKPGSYNLRPGMNDHEIALLLASGQAHLESELRLIEGWTVADETNYLQAEQHVRPDLVTLLAGNGKTGAAFDPALRKQYSFLTDLPNARSLEGYLFPETYRVWDDQLPSDLVQKQLQEFQNRTAGFQITRAMAPLKTLDEAVILASIVEKEVPGDKDRKIVAGIFLRRLRDGMALQSDATLNYITGSGHVQATAGDLALDSPYNSYKNKGLPPGPICNPGMSSLDAVFNPSPTDYRYFLTDKQGNVLYATTLEEHKKNRVKAGY